MLHQFSVTVLVVGACYFGWQTTEALLRGEYGRMGAGLLMACLAVWALLVDVSTVDDGGRR